MHDEYTTIIKSLHGHQSGVKGVDIDLLIRTVLTKSTSCFHGRYTTPEAISCAVPYLKN
jgi:hypothetical protein